MTAPQRLEELPAGQRRRLVGRTVLVSLAIVALLLTGYYALPTGGAGAGELGMRITLAVVALFAAIAGAMRFVSAARYPALGLIEALAAVIGVAVVVFASTHLIISSNDASAFSEPLDHTGALYFTLTTATTIGYGDIVPRSDLARVVVMLHMVVNVAVVGLSVRALVRTTRQRMER